MKIALVCPYDWSFPGGVRSHVLGLARQLRASGEEVEIIAPASGTEAEIRVVGRSLPVPANGSVARIGFSRSASARVKELLLHGDFDLLHVHEPAAPSASLLALRHAGDLPVVATFHRAGSSIAYPIFRRPLARYFEKIDERIAVSKAARDLVAAHFPGEYHLLPNGVEGRRFRDAAPDPEVTSLKPCAVFVGRAEPRKGFEVLVEAVSLIRGRIDVRLVTTGAPKDAPEWVVPLGPVGDERLPGVFSAADVFCAPSLGGESFGMVLLEAMSAGAPVAASDLPGYREAAGEAALLSPAGDAPALAENLYRLLSDRTLAEEMRARGAERSAQFDWSVLLPRMLEVYRRAGQRRIMGRTTRRKLWN